MSESAPSQASAALGTAALLSLLVAIPATLRADSGSSQVLVFGLLAGSAALVSGCVAASLQELRADTRALRTIVLAALVTLPALAVFGRVLKVATHHRALGGVTFALVGALVFLGALVVSARAWSWASTQPRVRAVQAVGALAALASVRFCLPIVSQAETRWFAVDGVLLVASALVASRWIPHSSLKNRALARGLWGALVAVALGVLLASPAAQEAARGAAPVLYGPFWLLSR